MKWEAQGETMQVFYDFSFIVRACAQLVWVQGMFVFSWRFQLRVKAWFDFFGWNDFIVYASGLKNYPSIIIKIIVYSYNRCLLDHPISSGRKNNIFYRKSQSFSLTIEIGKILNTYQTTVFTPITTKSLLKTDFYLSI